MPLKAGIGVSTNRNHNSAVKEAVDEAKRQIKEEHIDLAFLFSTIDFAHHGVTKALANILGQVPVLGCSGLATITARGILKSSIAILLLAFPKDVHFNTACTQEISTKPLALPGEELAAKLLQGFSDVSRRLSLIFSDGAGRDNSGLIGGLKEKLGTSFPLVGACASNNLTSQKTFIYYNQEILSDACCGVLWGGKLYFGLGVKHGWKPLGKPRYISRSQHNVINEIDGMPAIRIYEEYLGGTHTDLHKDLERISILYPIGLFLEGEHEYLLRNAIGSQDDGSLVFRGDIPKDATVRLMISTKDSCLAATKEAALQAKNTSSSAIDAKSVAMIFNSAYRYEALGKDAPLELAELKETLGAATPFIGVYTYGEQAPLRSVDYLGKSYFHNQSITILNLTA